MRNKLIRNIVVALLGIGIAIQFVPYGRAHSNPPVRANPSWDSPHTRELFYRACADCHSNETARPWYSNIAPASWLVQKDIDDGREKFNISEFGLRRDKSDEAAEEVEKGAMPMAIYLPLHPSANLSASEKQELINGLKATFGGE